MATVFKPFGLKPVYHPSGLDRSTAFVGTNTYNPGTTFTAPYSLAAGQSFYEFQPVAITTTGQLTIASAAATGAGATKVFGVFNGVEYTDSSGRRSVAKSISKAALDASTEILFWIFSDPALVYEAQVHGSAGTDSLGKEYNFDATAGNTPADGITIGNGGAGFSVTALAATAVATGTQGQVRVVGLGREVAYPAGSNNAWGDAFTILQVQICNNQFAAPSVAV